MYYAVHLLHTRHVGQQAAVMRKCDSRHRIISSKVSVGVSL